MKKVIVFIISLCLFLCISACEDNKLTADGICKNLSSVQTDEAKLSDFTKKEDDGKTFYFADILSSTNTNRGTLTVTEKEGNFEGLMINISTPNPEYVSAIANRAIEDLGIGEKSRGLIKEKMLSLSDLNVTHLLDSDGFRITSRTNVADSGAGFVFFIASGLDISDYKEGSYQEIKSE